MNAVVDKKSCRFVCSFAYCVCTTQKGCSSHLATLSISSSSMCHLTHTPSYTHKLGCLQTFQAFSMTCQIWTGVTVRRAVRHSEAVKLRNLCCGTLINIEYRAISGQIHRLYLAGLINSFVLIIMISLGLKMALNCTKNGLFWGQNEITKGSSFVNIISYKCLKSRN